MRITTEMNTQTLSTVDLFGEFNPNWDFYSVKYALEAVEWTKVVACEFAFTTEVSEDSLRKLFMVTGGLGVMYQAENALVAQAVACGKTKEETIDRIDRIQRLVARLQNRAQFNN